jgi:hypothetical protein
VGWPAITIKRIRRWWFDTFKRCDYLIMKITPAGEAAYDRCTLPMEHKGVCKP